MRFQLQYVSVLFTALLFFPALVQGKTVLPINHARVASVLANSEHAQEYSAQYAVDGVVADEGGTWADYQHCWCTANESASPDEKDKGFFVLRWDSPVDVAEIVYWGRTSYFIEECWKDYQVFLDDQEQPVAQGSFEMKHGPQRIVIPKTRVSQVKLVFTSSHGGRNPGAAEIMALSDHPTDFQLKTLIGDPTPEPLTDASIAAQEYLTRDLKQFIAIKRFEIKATHVYTYHYEGFRPGGGLYLFDVDELKANPFSQGKCLVPTPEGQILDADLSYDGKAILFSWREKESEPYHLWSINVDGTDLKQLTNGPWHDYNPCWLPDGNIAFLSSRNPQFAYCWDAPVGILHRMRPDGSQVIQLSDNYLNDFTPTVLSDGRIIYGRWEYVDRPAIPIQSLWTLNPDGTNLKVFFGNRVLSPATFMEARTIPGTELVLCTMTGHGGPTRGAVGILDRRYGVNAQEAIRNLTPEIPMQNVDEGNGDWWPKQIYSGPYPLDAERFLVAAKGPIFLRTYEFDATTGTPNYAVTLLPEPENGMQYLCPVPIRSRPVPPTLSSDLLNPEYLMADPQEDSSQVLEPYATIAMQDIYQGLFPAVERGDVAAIRIVREMPKTVRVDTNNRTFGFQFPTISCGATYAGKMILGDVPVEEDGSAYFKVGIGATRVATGLGGHIPRHETNDFPELAPTTGAIYFIALDKEGRGIQRMRSFTHLMPGEKQTCVGCHDSRSSAPPSDVKLIKAMEYEPVVPVLPDWADMNKLAPDRAAFSPGFDYVRVVQPVWDRYCIDCHNSGGRTIEEVKKGIQTNRVNHPNGIDLTGGYTEYFNVSYDVLASENQNPLGSPYVSWISTLNGQEWNILEISPKVWGSYNSLLANLIRSGHPDKAGNKRFEMDDESKRKVFAWIDLNVPYYASSETSHIDIPGCRMMYPKNLDVVLDEVGSRRCAECHSDGNVKRREWMHYSQNYFRHQNEGANGIAPRRTWVRITEPELNPFLLAPLAKSAGGTEQCGKIIFESRNDPDYLKILDTFKPIQDEIAKCPRIDMPGGVPASDVCRITH